MTDITMTKREKFMQVMTALPLHFTCKTSRALQRGDKGLIGIQMYIGIVSPVIHVIDRDCT